MSTIIQKHENTVTNTAALKQQNVEAVIEGLENTNKNLNNEIAALRLRLSEYEGNPSKPSGSNLQQKITPQGAPGGTAAKNHNPQRSKDQKDRV